MYCQLEMCSGQPSFCWPQYPSDNLRRANTRTFTSWDKQPLQQLTTTVQTKLKQIPPHCAQYPTPTPTLPKVLSSSLSNISFSVLFPLVMTWKLGHLKMIPTSLYNLCEYSNIQWFLRTVVYEEKYSAVNWNNLLGKLMDFFSVPKYNQIDSLNKIFWDVMKWNWQESQRVFTRQAQTRLFVVPQF